jgi:hypothetical protein
MIGRVVYQTCRTSGSETMVIDDMIISKGLYIVTDKNELTIESRTINIR